MHQTHPSEMFRTLLVIPVVWAVLTNTGVARADSSAQFKQLAGPPSEMHAMAPPDPESSVARSQSAVLKIELRENSNGRWRWQTEIPVEGESLRVALMSETSGISPSAWSVTVNDETRRRSEKPSDTDIGVIARTESLGGRPAKLYEFKNLIRGSSLSVLLESDAPGQGYLLIQGVGPARLLSHQTTFNQMVGRRIGVVASIYEDESAAQKTRLARVNSAFLYLTTPDNKVLVTTMRDDGQHDDGRAGDGIYGGDFVASSVGIFSAQVVFTGYDSAGSAFIRTAEHLIPIIADEMSLHTNSASAALVGAHRLAIKLSVGVTEPKDHYRVLAEVWGTPKTGGNVSVPIAWIGGMTAVRENALVLGLDTRWIALSGAQEPFELRNIRIEESEFFVTVASAKQIPISIPNLPPLDPRADRIVVDEEMLMGPRPTTIDRQIGAYARSTAKDVSASIQVAQSYTDGTGHILLLVHGYCSSDVWSQVKAQFNNSGVFLDLNQNHSIDAFALRIKNAALAWNSYAIVAHSQGGMAALHLYANYWSGLDNAGPGRLIQSVGTPYLGTPLMSVNGFFGGVFSCGYQQNLTPSGAAAWLSGIPTTSRAKVNYYTTSFTDYALQDDWCNSVTDVLLNAPDDGVVEQARGQLSGGVNRGHTVGQCHSSGFGFNREGPQYLDSNRNAVMSTNAAVGPPVLVTGAASGVGQSSATLNGTVNPSGATTTSGFDYGFTDGYGSSIAAETRTGFTTQSISAVPLLECGKTYHFRAKGTNSAGIRYGSDRVFTTSACSYSISVSALPVIGGTVIGGGTFNAGSSRTVTASANSGYTFNNWTENGNIVSQSASYTFTLNGNRSLVANFGVVLSTYTISVSASPQGGGTVSGGGAYPAGSSRTVTASASNGYTFNNWRENGNVVSSSASYTFTLNGNRSLIANFNIVSSTYTISLSSSPQAGGTVGGGGAYAAGSSRTVTASANSGYTFNNWTENGIAVSSSASYTFSLNSNRSLVANFTGTSVGGAPHPFVEVAGAAVQVHDLGVGGDGSVYVLFARSDPKELLVVKSTSGGESWQQPVTIPNSDHTNSDFEMAVDSAGVIHVVWSVSSEDQAYYSRSTNGGSSFSNPISVRSGNSYSGYSTRNAVAPVVAADGLGDVYVAFGGYTMNSSGTFLGYNVWVARSANGGNSFQAEVPINAISSSQKKPRRIRATASNFYVLYLDETNDDLYFHRSTAGALASNPRVNSHADAVDSSGDFVVGPGETTFYAVYSDTFNDSEGNITFCTSTDGGTNWSTCRTVNDNTHRHQDAPAIGIDSAGRVHVAWSDLRGDEYQTYYAYSTDGGAVFSPNVDVSDPFTTSGFTQAHLVVDNGSTSLYISATRETSQVMVARRSTNVQAPTDLTPPTGSIVVNSGATYTNSASVTLTLNATDAVGVVGYYTSNSSTNPSAGQAGWVSVGSTTSFSHVVNGWPIADEGTRSVRVWFKDAAGNVSVSRSDAIVLDQTPPTNPVLTTTVGVRNVQLGWGGQSDALSGVASTRLVFAVGSTPPATCGGTSLATLSPFTHTGLIPGQIYAYRVCATDFAGNTSSGSTATATPLDGPTARTRNDVDGDGKADLFWRNGATGETSIWFMNGSTYSSAVRSTTVPIAWTPAVAGDFDGDSKTDFFWRNSSTGATSTWLGWNGSLFATQIASPTVPVGWVPLAAGDIDGDLKDDIFWRNSTTGETSIWFMNGSTYSNAIRSTTVPTSWVPDFLGDFDGDSRSDIFWRNPSTGETSLWMGWTGAAFAVQIRSVTASPVWVPAGAGDISGDERSDILWRNSSTGQTSLWVMNGASTPGFVVLSTVPTNWSPAAFGDYDADTHADVFWRDPSTGETSIWTGYNGTLFTTQIRSTTIPTAWVPFHSR